MKWRNYYLVLVFLIGLPNCGEDCAISNPLGSLQSVRGRYLEVLQVFPDGSLFTNKLDPNIPNNFQRVGIHLTFEIDVLAHNGLSSFGFGNVALACDSSFAVIQDTVSHILITSDKDYDDDHGAGESLNELFVMTTHNAIPQSFELIAQPMAIENYLLLERPATQFLSFILNKPPLDLRRRSFALEIQLRNGTKFELEMPQIFVSP